MTALTLTVDGGIARITLTQPEIRNAFSDEVIAEITTAFHTAGNDPMCAPSCWPPKVRLSAPVPI